MKKTATLRTRVRLCARDWQHNWLIYIKYATRLQCRWTSFYHWLLLLSTRAVTDASGRAVCTDLRWSFLEERTLEIVPRKGKNIYFNYITQFPALRSVFFLRGWASKLITRRLNNKTDNVNGVVRNRHILIRVFTRSSRSERSHDVAKPFFNCFIRGNGRSLIKPCNGLFYQGFSF